MPRLWFPVRGEFAQTLIRRSSFVRTICRACALLCAMLALMHSSTLLGAAATNPATPPASSQPAESAVPGVETGGANAAEKGAEGPPQNYNLHVQNTDIIQGDPIFPAKYSGPQSLNNKGEDEETVSLDVFAGRRLWPGAEAHMDLLMWQGYGLSKTLGVEAFPNADAYKAGAWSPDFTFAHLFVRQTIGLGGEQEDVADDQLTLAGKQDISRLTFTVGRFPITDIFDANAYAGNPNTQFMNWANVANLAWDYPADVIGYTTGIAVELNQPQWAWRYGFFQLASQQNGLTGEDQFLTWPHGGSDGSFFQSWAMVNELEGRYNLGDHPGKIRFEAWLNEANMASYSAATAILVANGPGANISAAQAARYKYGFGLNWEQEVARNVGLFSRLGWNDGREEAWVYTDANWTASLGLSVKGEAWHRSDDTWGLSGILSGASSGQQKFLEAGGLGILDGDGALSYSPEKVLETYYDVQLCKYAHVALDYQFIDDPAFNRDRGPVSVLGARLHWQF